jgi:phospholipase C
MSESQHLISRDDDNIEAVYYMDGAIPVTEAEEGVTTKTSLDCFTKSARVKIIIAVSLGLVVGLVANLELMHYPASTLSQNKSIKDPLSKDPSFSIMASSNVIEQNALVNVTWINGDRSSRDDWIAFWHIGQSPPESPAFVKNAWRYTYGGNSPLAGSVAVSTPSGTVAITSPSSVGDYYVFYCTNDSFTCPASTKITVVAATVPAVTCSPKGTLSSIKHLVIVETENHSFDSMYGSYCKAPTGSTPTNNYGPTACDAPPATVSGVPATVLTDGENLDFDPNHSQLSMSCLMNGGKMDQYVQGCSSSDRRNFAAADTSPSGSASYYGKLASSTAASNMNSAMADRFFQSAVGASSENDMYFAIPQFMFLDNTFVPQNSSLNGARCYSEATHDFMSYFGATIYDLLDSCSVSWVAYAEGWDANPSSAQCYPYFFDASDYAQSYFPSLTSDPGAHWRDYKSFFTDVSSGSLPSISHVRGKGENSEHPGLSSITGSTAISKAVVDAISASHLYSEDTLIVIVPDESGSYYDHITPPSASAIDSQFYGPRTYFIAVGKAVKAPSSDGGFISHQQMEVSSLLKFMEWNWLNGETGQLRGRDMVCANIGSLLDPMVTAIPVPEF